MCLFQWNSGLPSVRISVEQWVDVCACFRAYELLEAAALLNHTAALELVAETRLFGDQLPQNVTRAAELFHQLSMLGSPKGQMVRTKRNQLVQFPSRTCCVFILCHGLIWPPLFCNWVACRFDSFECLILNAEFLQGLGFISSTGVVTNSSQAKVSFALVTCHSFLLIVKTRDARIGHTE